jgi:transcriptional regulator
MTSRSGEYFRGVLELLVLRTLGLGPNHGWGVAKRIQETSRDVLQVSEGSLYPALHRLERKGLIESEWGTSQNNRRAKYYRLTPAGEAELERESRQYRRFAVAVELVLQL